jgi:stearoyl-CoA desaturase (delta-9 desaturase)
MKGMQTTTSPSADIISGSSAQAPQADDKASLIASIPYYAVHLGCLAALWVGVNWVDVALCIGLYYLRMFGITAGYHRYFSHRAYKTSRAFQFVLALLGTLSIQKGVLWWAAHHRSHHKYSDQPRDIHSPVQRGLYWAHQGWILCHKYDATDWPRIQDFAKYPELVWLNNHFLIPPMLAGGLLYLLGGWHFFVWGGLISTVLLWHGTFTINSLSHVWGKRRYQTTDDSRNNWVLAILTMGEGWHNNHHHYQSTANQGFFWWEVDFSYYILKLLSVFGIVWDLRKPPKHILENKEALLPNLPKQLEEGLEAATLNPPVNVSL